MAWFFDNTMEWVEKALTYLLNFITTEILGTFNYDLAKFVDYFPFAKTAYGVITAVGASLVILFFVFAIYKNYLGPLSDGENQLGVIFKSLMAIILVAQGFNVCNIILNIIKTPYNQLLNLANPTSEYASTDTSQFGQTIINMLRNILDPTQPLFRLVEIILIIILGFNYIKLVMEIIERYVVVGTLSYLSPLGFSTLATKATSNIFKAFCRMFGSECLLLLMNVWFVRGANTAIASLAVMDYHESKEMGLLHMLAVIAFLKVGQKIDAYMAQLGLNTAQTGGMLGAEVLGTAAAIGHVAGRAMMRGGFGGGAGGRGGPGGNAGSIFQPRTAGANANPAAQRSVASGNFANAMQNKNKGVYSGNSSNPNSQAMKDANALWGNNGQKVTSVSSGNGVTSATIQKADGSQFRRDVVSEGNGYRYIDTPIGANGEIQYSSGGMKGDMSKRGTSVDSFDQIGNEFKGEYGNINPGEARSHAEGVLNGSGGETLTGDEANVAAAAMFSDANPGSEAEFTNTSFENGHMSTDMQNEDGSSTHFDATQNADGTWSVNAQGYDAEGNEIGSPDGISYTSDSMLGGADNANDVARGLDDLNDNGYAVDGDSLRYSDADGFSVTATDADGNDVQFSSKENADGSFDNTVQGLDANGDPTGDAFSYQSDTAMGGVGEAQDVAAAADEMSDAGYDTSVSHSADDGFTVTASDENGSMQFNSQSDGEGGYNISAQEFDANGNPVGDAFNYQSDTPMGGIAEAGGAADAVNGMEAAGYDASASYSAENGFTVNGTAEDGSQMSMSSTASASGGFDNTVTATDADGNSSSFGYHSDTPLEGGGEAAGLADTMADFHANGYSDASVSYDGEGFSINAKDHLGNNATWTSTDNGDGTYTVSMDSGGGDISRITSDTPMGGAAGMENLADKGITENAVSYNSQTGQYSAYTADPVNGNTVTNYDGNGNAVSSFRATAGSDFSSGTNMGQASEIGGSVSDMGKLGYDYGAVQMGTNGTSSVDYQNKSTGERVSVSSTPSANGGFDNSVRYQDASGHSSDYSYHSDSAMGGVSDHISGQKDLQSHGFTPTAGGASYDSATGISTSTYRNNADGSGLIAQSASSAGGGYDHTMTMTNADGSTYSHSYHSNSAAPDMSHFEGGQDRADQFAGTSGYTATKSSSDGHGGFSASYSNGSGETMSVHSAKSADGGYDHLVSHTNAAGQTDSFRYHSESKNASMSEYTDMQSRVAAGLQGSDYTPVAVSSDGKGGYAGTFRNNATGDTMTVNASKPEGQSSYNVNYSMQNSRGETVGGGTYASQGSPFDVGRYSSEPFKYTVGGQRDSSGHVVSAGTPDASYYANSDVIAASRTKRINDNGTREIVYPNGETGTISRNSAGVNTVERINRVPVGHMVESRYAERAPVQAPNVSQPVSQPRSSSGGSGSGRRGGGSHVFTNGNNPNPNRDGGVSNGSSRSGRSSFWSNFSGKRKKR